MLLQPHNSTQNVNRFPPTFRTRGHGVIVSARRQQQQSPTKTPNGKTRPLSDIVLDHDGPHGLLRKVSEDGLPQAPSPSIKPKEEDSDDLPYPVFPPNSQAAQAVQDAQDAPWTWNEQGQSSAEVPKAPPLPQWNPYTGFMLPPGASSSSTQTDSQHESQPLEPQVSLTAPVTDDTEELPFVSQQQIMTASMGTSMWMTLLAFMMRAYAQINAPDILGTDEALLSEYLYIPGGLENWGNAGVVVGAAVLITGLRYSLMNVWPEFRRATERSNKHLLGPLSWLDTLLVSAMTGVSEEILFRGGIFPATLLDWRGVLLSGAISALILDNGRRNTRFAAWAAVQGCLYGSTYLLTHNIWVPVAAHALVNLASSFSWKFNSEPDVDPL